MKLDPILTVSAVGAAAMFVGGVFYGFLRDVRRWWGEARETIRMSEAITLENERMRCQCDDEDALDPRLVEEIEAEARWVAEVADLEMTFALPTYERP